MRPFTRKDIIVLILLLIGCGLAFYITHKRAQTVKWKSPSTDSCTVDTCGAIDPVNDPDYNMRNIVKQSILLEEHIAEGNKYCISCIVKHFLHIIGLAEEATWMAGSKVDDYPFLRKSVAFYTSVFEKWRSNKHNDVIKTQVLDELRKMRRDLIDAYFLQ